MKPEIILKKLSLDHVQSLYDAIESNRQHLKDWLPWLDQIKSDHDIKSFIESIREESSSIKNLNFAILHNTVICGVAGFHEINIQHGIGSIGYWLAKSYTGQGIATTAVAELVKLGFEKYRLNKIEIHCAANNTKSRAIPERLRFTYEATLRQREWLYTQYVDHAIYSILATEYHSYKAHNLHNTTA